MRPEELEARRRWLRTVLEDAVARARREVPGGAVERLAFVAGWLGSEAELPYSLIEAALEPPPEAN